MSQLTVRQADNQYGKCLYSTDLFISRIEVMRACDSSANHDIVLSVVSKKITPNDCIRMHCQTAIRLANELLTLALQCEQDEIRYDDVS